MAEITWTPYALEDLQSVYDYIALDSPHYAIRFIANRLIKQTY